MGTTDPPILSLPGFLPDAVPFAARTGLALLLAYLVAFAAQVDSASTAGVCVGIVAQPSAGMSIAKARYRLLGTVVGAVAAMMLLSAFPQNRTMLLAGFVLWMGVCSAVAALLRDFRSYGAALSGYTAGIIAVAAIDAPQNGMLDALNRVAAIVIGIGAVAAVNHLTAGTGAFDGLVRELRGSLDRVTALALDALNGVVPGDFPLARAAGNVSRLQTEAGYAAAELPDGRARADGARHAIAALLSMATASRTIADALGSGAAGRAVPAATRDHLRAVAAALRDPALAVEAAPPATMPDDALLLERADTVLAAHRDARRGLRRLVDGEGPVPRSRLGLDRDRTGALLGALRTMVAVTFGSVFCVLAGWNGATLVLIQQAAMVTLLNAAPDPVAATGAFTVPLIPFAVLVGLVEFLVLPQVSGFVPFALAVGPLMVLAALLSRHARFGRLFGSATLFVTLLLGPANMQAFDLAAYCDTTLQLVLAMLFTTLAFGLVLHDPPKRHVRRLARAVAAGLRRTLRDPARRPDACAGQSLLFDRMARVFFWLGVLTAGQARLVGLVFAAGQVELAVHRARDCLTEVERVQPDLRAPVTIAREALRDTETAAMRPAAQALLDRAVGAAAGPARGAASAMAEIVALLEANPGIPRLCRRLA